ncbi:MAG: hypothetical protein Ct9H90mP30_3010 [Actinomycetota bacterium]|nr:MAG: hypothetical protein Ct9H90mP30_3010 [Actinomycetota bacterium]
MADAITVSGAISADDKTMKLETGVLASLANGAVVVSVGKKQQCSLLRQQTRAPSQERISFR